MATAATIELLGVDGSRWVLAGPGQGAEGVELGTAPSGLYDAPVKTEWVSSAFQYGATHVGTDWLRRDVVFGVNIVEIPGMSWEEVDSAWRKAWDYDRDSTLIITTEYGTRRLALRLTEQLDVKFTKDPHLKRWARCTVTAAAGVPWWVEDDVTYTAATARDTTAANAAPETLWLPVSNPTDRPMRLVWVCSAPGKWTLPDFSWADDAMAARTITMPLLRTGQHITVDTDPMEEMVVATDGSSVWARMNGQAFLHAVPAYTTAALVPVQVVGAPVGTAITVRMRRNWSRPWGLQ